jgi:hypothetical protein
MSCVAHHPMSDPQVVIAKQLQDAKNIDQKLAVVRGWSAALGQHDCIFTGLVS